MLNKILLLLTCLAVSILAFTPAHADETCNVYDDNAGDCTADSHDGFWRAHA